MRNIRQAPGIGYVLVILVVVFSAFGSGFATAANVFNIGVQSSVLLLLALPMTLVIMSEGLDLSMGAVLSLAGVVLATLLMNGRPLPLAFAAAVGVGAAFGLANGLLVVGLGIPPFVATLGTLGIAQGLALVATGGQSVVGIGDALAGALREPPARHPVLDRGRDCRVFRFPFCVPPDPVGFLRVGHRRQSRVAGAGRRARQPVSRRHLRGGGSDGGVCRAAADGPHEQRPPHGCHRHGVRRHRGRDRRRHVLRAGKGQSCRHAPGCRHDRRAQERAQRARGCLVSASGQHRRADDCRARDRVCAAGRSAVRCGGPREGCRLPSGGGGAHRCRALAHHRVVLHDDERAQRVPAGEPDVPDRVGSDADDSHGRTRSIGRRQRRPVRLPRGHRDAVHRIGGARRAARASCSVPASGS